MCARKDKKKEYKSTKPKLGAGILEVGEGRVKQAETQSPWGNELLGAEASNVLVATPKGEQGFPPVNQHRSKQLTEILKSRCRKAPQEGGLAALVPLSSQAGAPTEELSGRTTGSCPGQKDTFTFRLLCPAESSLCRSPMGAHSPKVFRAGGHGAHQLWQHPEMLSTYSHTEKRKTPGASEFSIHREESLPTAAHT